MPVFNTVADVEHQIAFLRKEGIEPIVVDGKISALQIGTLRIAASTSREVVPLVVWTMESETGKGVPPSPA